MVDLPPVAVLLVEIRAGPSRTRQLAHAVSAANTELPRANSSRISIMSVDRTETTVAAPAVKALPAKIATIDIFTP